MSDRSIKLTNVRLDGDEPNRLWVKVGKFDVFLNHTEEGIVVDIWPRVEPCSSIEPDEPLTSCYAYDSDADAALEGPDED